MTSFHNIRTRRPLKAGRLTASIAALLAFAAVALAAGAPAPALAQPGEEWRTALGGAADEFAHAVALSGDGGYVIAGETRSYGAGAQDGWLVKLDANGRRQWARTYGGPQSDVIYSVQKTSDGGYILAGETASPAGDADPDATSTPPQSDFWLIKTNARGITQWERNYGGIEHILSPASGPPPTASRSPMPLQETAYAVRQTRDGGYILAGSSVGSSGAGVWLLRTAPDGELLWSRNPGVAPGAVAHSVAETPDNGFIIAGHAQTPAGGADALLIKTDADGNTAWTKSYGGQYNDEARALTLTADGGYALAGFTWSDSAGLSDFWLVKAGPNGNRQWQRSYGGPYNDAAHALIPTADGGYALAGWSESLNLSGVGHFWIVKTGPAGRLQWDHSYPLNSPTPAGARALRQTEDGGFIVAGWTGAIPGARDILAIKTAPIEPRDPAPAGPVVSLRNSGAAAITSAAVGFRAPGSAAAVTPRRFWRNGRLIDRDNPLPPGAVACTQSAPGLVDGAALALDQIGAFDSLYLNALSHADPPPAPAIDGQAVPFDFGGGLAGNIAVKSQSPCDQSDLLLAEGPPAPAGLNAQVSETHPGAIALDWSDSGESGSSGYAVYVARQSSGPFRRIAWLLPESAYTDTGSGDGATYYYAVSAINSWGLESPKSAVESVQSQDITPPPPPARLRVTGIDRPAGRAALQWRTVANDDIQGYRLYRRDGDGPRALITPAPVIGTRYVDFSLPSKGDFTYSVTAIDRSGNESAHSAIAPPELDFFGAVLETRPSITGGGRLLVNTARGPVDIEVTPATEISIPEHPGAGLDGFDPGDQVAVALQPDGASARQIHLVPTKPRNRHLAGRVIRLSQTRIVIQPAGETGSPVTLPLSPSARITLHRGAPPLAAGAFVIVSTTAAPGASAPAVSEINVIPGPEPEQPPEPPPTPGNVAVLRGIFQGISPATANIILSSVEVSLNTHTVMAAGLSVGEAVLVEAALLPDGSLLAQRVAPDDGISRIPARTILRGVFQEAAPSFEATGAGHWTISGVPVLVDRRTYADALPYPGQRVKVTAILSDDGTLRAREIENQPTSETLNNGHTVWIEGIFREITPAGAWSVGGLPVKVNAATVLSGRPSVGRPVAVTATYADGRLLASQVSAAPSDPDLPVRSVRIRGEIQQRQPGRWLVVDGLRVALSDLTKTRGDIQVGASVIVKAEIQADGAIVAREIAETDAGDETRETRANPVDIEGRIERLDTGGGLLVNGIPVAISALTAIDAPLQVGAPVQVRGLLRRDGSVLAREILGYGPGITGGSQAAIEGVVGSVAAGPDGQVSRFVIDGIQITVDRLTRLEPGLAAGVTVSVQGIAIGGEILAVSVEPRPIAQDLVPANGGVPTRLQMQGVVENMPASPVPLPFNITINGVTVRVSNDTRLIGSLTGGAVVKAAGRISNGVFVAQEIERIAPNPSPAAADGESPQQFSIQGLLQEARLDSDGRPDRLLVAGEPIIVQALTVLRDQVSVGDSISVTGETHDGILIATLITLHQTDAAAANEEAP